MSVTYKISENSIPANELMNTMHLSWDFIENREKLLEKTPNQTWEELDLIAGEQGIADFLQHIETKYDMNAKHMFNEIFKLSDTINDCTRSSIYASKQTPSISLGVLAKRLPEELAQEYSQAFEKASILLRNYYANDSEFNKAAEEFKKQLESKESLEAELVEDEAETLHELEDYSNGNDFFMITVFCDNPLEFELSADQEADLIDEMRDLEQNQIRIDLTIPETHNKLNTPRLKA